MAFTTLPTSAYSTLDATKLTGALPSISGASLTGISGGLSQFDVWGLTSSQTVSSGETVLTAWGRLTSRSRGNEGSAMTESSGVFTFPSTGKYLIVGNFWANGYTSTHYRGVQLMNNSNEVLQVSYTHGQGSDPSWHHGTVTLNTILDVTDTTNDACKVKFKTNAGGATTWVGSSNDGKSTMLFIKLGDT
tara:strand:- start:202 stop:771 length:570 start_codon:yes stop_codon:yes gene_type:complete